MKSDWFDCDQSDWAKWLLEWSKLESPVDYSQNIIKYTRN